MAINGENGVSAVTVDELLKQGLRIPNYQRPYSWDVSTALQLVDDISEALRDTERKDIPYGKQFGLKKLLLVLQTGNYGIFKFRYFNFL